MSKKYTTNFLEDTNGSTGSANQVLVSTAAGIDWVDGSGSGIIGGPYLPLSAGSAAPLTGTLYLATASNLGKLQFGTANSDYYIRGGGNYGYININGPIVRFDTNGSEKMRITSAGNVGIGTTSPTGILDVLSTDAQRYARFRAPNGEERFQFYIGSTGNSSVLNMFRSDGTTQGVKVSSEGNSYFNGGNVGIGTTSPAKPLDVRTDIGVLIKGASGSSNAKISLVPASGGRQYDLGNSGSDFRIFDASAGITRMHFDNDGNTGIGTTNPSQKLEVDGQVLSDGYRLAAMQTAPATRNSAGTLGEIVIDGNHIYVCYATDSWSRVALETSW